MLKAVKFEWGEERKKMEVRKKATYTKKARIGDRPRCG